jgi:hypothetical protein
VVEASTVPVSEKRLEMLEQEHKYLHEIRAASAEATEAKIDYENAKAHSLELKKAYERKVAEMQEIINNGPPKPDPQGKLPFVDDEAPIGQDVKTEAVAEEPKDAPVPAEIVALDLTDKQKQALANAGAKSLADVADIGNGNWPQYPDGFNSIKGLGPKAIERLVSQLPSTAPKIEEKPGQAPSSTVKVELLTMSAASPNLEVGDQYEATLLDDGNVVIQLPGEDPVSFSSGEYRIVEQQSA